MCVGVGHNSHQGVLQDFEVGGNKVACEGRRCVGACPPGIFEMRYSDLVGHFVSVRVSKLGLWVLCSEALDMELFVSCEWRCYFCPCIYSYNNPGGIPRCMTSSVCYMHAHVHQKLWSLWVCGCRQYARVHQQHSIIISRSRPSWHCTRSEPAHLVLILAAILAALHATCYGQPWILTGINRIFSDPSKAARISPWTDLQRCCCNWITRWQPCI